MHVYVFCSCLQSRSRPSHLTLHSHLPRTDVIPSTLPSTPKQALHSLTPIRIDTSLAISFTVHSGQYGTVACQWHPVALQLKQTPYIQTS
jgi:hypothetical protein